MSLGLSLTLLAGPVSPTSAQTREALTPPADAPPGVSARAASQETPGRNFTESTRATMRARTEPAQLPAGSLARNPVTDRREVVVPDIRRTAVLIGDSQSAGKDRWPQLALRELGYTVRFVGAGGTGFVAANETGDANYYDSLTRGDWVLPHGDPALVVVEGGGNDAFQGASDGDILAGANALVLELGRTYPSSRMVMIGTLSRSAEDGGGRRHEVDTLLADLADKRGVPFVSAGDWLTTHQLKAFLADDVHLGAAGHQRAAHVLEQELRALKLGVAYTSIDPLLRWPRDRRPLE
ncbi:SGNH/GDSL hydrolase family protein [Arthrobacter sedimenti]|uniref:SGNH/GDSL hydrolase family protein n=1 Tax=Arthrobacter sedimenti TaxID=2694931 RepID=UPI001CDB8585|nr:SGNH/GDSL hydrolase family protein [Arthrobacter sedimenti]